jgi:hypothetical protein
VIHEYRDAIASSGVLTDVEVSEDIIVGRARVSAAQADVWVNVDPELGDGDAPDVTALLRGIDQILGVSPTHWALIIDQIVSEIEAAVGDEPVQEAIRLRDDLVLKSVVVFSGATLLRFEAPRQFPDNWIHAQPEEQLDLDDVAVDAREVNAETVSFSTLDELLDHISVEENRSKTSDGANLAINLDPERRIAVVDFPTTDPQSAIAPDANKVIHFLAVVFFRHAAAIP